VIVLLRLIYPNPDNPNPLYTGNVFYCLSRSVSNTNKSGNTVNSAAPLKFYHRRSLANTINLLKIVFALFISPSLIHDHGKKFCRLRIVVKKLPALTHHYPGVALMKLF